MTSSPAPADGEAKLGRRKSLRTWIAFAVFAASFLIAAYLLPYFLLRSYRHSEKVTMIFYGKKCIHLLGAPEDRLKFIRGVHAMPRRSPFDSVTGLYEDADEAMFRWSMVFVPAELLEDGIRGLFR